MTRPMSRVAQERAGLKYNPDRVRIAPLNPYCADCGVYGPHKCESEGAKKYCPTCGMQIVKDDIVDKMVEEDPETHIKKVSIWSRERRIEHNHE